MAPSLPPPSYCTRDEHEGMLMDTLLSLKKTLRNCKRVTLVGYFSCKEIRCKMFESEGCLYMGKQVSEADIEQHNDTTGN